MTFHHALSSWCAGETSGPVIELTCSRISHWTNGPAERRAWPSDGGVAKSGSRATVIVPPSGPAFMEQGKHHPPRLADEKHPAELNRLHLGGRFGTGTRSRGARRR